MTDYHFNLSTVRSLDDWWDQYLRVVNGEGSGFFGRNRDAYNDSLNGGPGAPRRPCRFIFAQCAALDRDLALAVTRRELEHMRTRVHPTNIVNVDAQLKLLRCGIGPTILNWIIDPPIEAGIEVVVKPGA